MNHSGFNRVGAIILLVFITVFNLPHNVHAKQSASLPSVNFWPVQSIDTMKYSRDRAREHLGNPSFDKVIDQQMTQIAGTGANYVAISTPYDAEFIPMLSRWVKSARSHGLKVWFRGNFSGWESWFNYPKINRTQHLEKLSSFIKSNQNLFADGDIFTSCPECENGGAGDPRRTQDTAGFRKFLIDENTAAQNAFGKIKKKIITNYYSMNGDVARLVMDKDTTAKLGGVVSIDHYVASPDKMIADIDALAKSSGGKIILGEFGAPIPDINGNFTDKQQADWMQETLDKLAKNPNVVGLNYWVNIDGSTALWSNNNVPRSAVSTLTAYYKPEVVAGRIINALSQPVWGAEISSPYKKVTTNIDGEFFLPKVSGASTTVAVTAESYQEQNVNLSDPTLNLVLEKTHESLWFRFLKWLRKI
jgi:hypothetical protein